MASFGIKRKINNAFCNPNLLAETEAKISGNMFPLQNNISNILRILSFRNESTTDKNSDSDDDQNSDDDDNGGGDGEDVDNEQDPVYEFSVSDLRRHGLEQPESDEEATAEGVLKSYEDSSDVCTVPTKIRIWVS